MSDPASNDPQSLISPVDAPTVVTTIYTSPPTGLTTKRGTRVIGVYVCNHTAGAVPYTLHHVPLGGAAAAANKLYDEVSIPAHETMVLAEGIILDQGDFFSHLAGAAASISVHIYGWESSDT